MKCVTCKGNHDVRSSECPRFQEETRVKRYSIRSNMTINEARQEIRQIDATYADITKFNSILQNSTTNDNEANSEINQSAANQTAPVLKNPQIATTYRTIASMKPSDFKNTAQLDIIEPKCSLCSDLKATMLGMSRQIEKLTELVSNLTSAITAFIPQPIQTKKSVARCVTHPKKTAKSISASLTKSPEHKKQKGSKPNPVCQINADHDPDPNIQHADISKKKNITRSQN